MQPVVSASDVSDPTKFPLLAAALPAPATVLAPFAPPLPADEAERLAALRGLCVLDTPPDVHLDRLVELACRAFDVPIALVSLVDEDRQWFLAKTGLETTQTPRNQAFCAYAIHCSEPTVVCDAARDPRFADNPMVTGPPHIRFYAGAPLTTREGHRLGTLCLIDHRAYDHFSARSTALLVQFAALATLRVESMGTIGHSDPLTGLPNRRRFIDDLGRRAARAEPRLVGTTAIAVDICGPVYGRDLVKALGHSHLDGYLLAAKNRLLTALPQGTRLYRIAATCFGLLVPARDAHDRLLDAVLLAFERPVEHDGIPHCAAVSIGVLHVAADQAPDDVYRALVIVTDDVRERQQQSGVFDPAYDLGQQRSFRVLTALSAALTLPDELSLHYQPRVRLVDGCCVGVEALLRWRHPVLGHIGPNEFIPLAEKTALIGRLTDWVVASALADAARWQRAGHRFCVGINVSATDLDRSDFVETLADQLWHASVDPRHIEIEFTESALVREPAKLQMRLQQMRGLGLQLAIDDFGTGYSNMTYLKRIPATTLKIDQSFVRSLPDDATDRAIVPAMIGLAQNLGHRVVAEGIETEAAYECLRDWGCDEGQGYWIARPMSAAALDIWLSSRQQVATAEPVSVTSSVASLAVSSVMSSATS